MWRWRHFLHIYWCNYYYLAWGPVYWSVASLGSQPSWCVSLTKTAIYLSQVLRLLRLATTSGMDVIQCMRYYIINWYILYWENMSADSQSCGNNSVWQTLDSFSVPIFSTFIIYSIKFQSETWKCDQISTIFLNNFIVSTHKKPTKSMLCIINLSVVFHRSWKVAPLYIAENHSFVTELVNFAFIDSCSDWQCYVLPYKWGYILSYVRFGACHCPSLNNTFCISAFKTKDLTSWKLFDTGHTRTRFGCNLWTVIIKALTYGFDRSDRWCTHFLFLTPINRIIIT